MKNLTIALAWGTMGLALSVYAQPPTPPTGPADHHEMKPHSFTDAQIVQILETTNYSEIEAGRLEKNHGKSDEAKSFAKDMIEQHEQNNKDVKELAKKLHMKPEKTAISDKIHEDAKVTNARLEKMKNTDLDRAYIDQQVEAHQHVLDKLDTTLIPEAKNDELKSLLQATRTTVEQHLEHAQNVQKSVNGGTASHQ